MIAYSYVGMYSRHILAILHFNSNLYREVKYKADGTEQLRVSYPKFKNGEATVRNVCITQNFDYVEELYDTFLTSSKEEIRSARDELQEMTPSPMNSVLQKQPVAEAIQKRLERRSMEVADTPATTPALQNQAQVQHEVPANRAPPKCRQCQQPMKGHNKVKDCPRNNKT
ncbi:uncharacterized protein LOC116295696 [Actinia tenebrosa]|uniref:Uncharacterized protein LOC116295696 n=1 Tax=Actinia tenebrosa TaxID=6105 RepID=A0A6P8I3I1_ACTTE|nr:uncharacterized protein LOC116295696 [Actinia tenebrosa]